MCTAITYTTKDFYFGRTLDYDCSFNEQVTITPRRFPLVFRHKFTSNVHYSMIGMAHIANSYPLYYDAVNEMGLAMAGLNFVNDTYYNVKSEAKDNIAQFEFIPWVLSDCASVKEAKKLLQNINITADPFNESLPVAKLHWLIADRQEAITVEALKDGLAVFDNPVGVLTNSPPFYEQMSRINDYMHLSPKPPRNNFSKKLKLHPYSRGMGAIGLPGDLSSSSRFVRAVFTKLNSVSENTEQKSVAQFFHILDTVSQTNGCCELENGNYEKTIYSSCCNADRGIYYYTTYDNRNITAVHLHNENLDSDTLVGYPLIVNSQPKHQN